ncbi:MAG: ExbD/TolR family protein [bacterium]|jgi:biopolymer transport protein ExbD
MSKVKIPRKSTVVDMTAMTDVAFLLLTFFMLATKFKPDEPVMVTTPSSISEIKLPETDILLLTIDKDSRVFFSMDGDQNRIELLNKMAEKYQLNFTDAQKKEFSLLSSFGVSIKNLGDYLNQDADARKNYPQTGIPSDSTNNELADWIVQARYTNKDLRFAIKGDGDAGYPVIKQVLATLQEKKVNRFNFITSLEKANE